jgi:CheY-like chemotaxis protein
MESLGEVGLNRTMAGANGREIYTVLAWPALACRSQAGLIRNVMANERILVVDDEEDIRDITRLLLENAAYEVTACEDGASALAALGRQTFDLVIVDMLMPEMDGVEMINEMHRRDPGQKILAMSGGGHAPKESYLQIARMCGVQALLAKPFNQDQLLRAVESALAAGPGRAG